MNFSPELTGIGKFSGEMARGLQARGFDVHVVCAPPYYPQWQVQAGHSAQAYTTEKPLPGLTVHRCPVWVPRQPGGRLRVLHLASFAITSVPVLLWQAVQKPAVVMAVVPALFTAPMAWLVARWSGAQAWLHVQDLEIDAAFKLGLLKSPLARRLMLGTESWLMRRFDVVSTLSEQMRNLLIDKGVSPTRTTLLPNGVDVDHIWPLPPAAAPVQALRQRLGVTPRAVVCLFAGTTNRKQGLDVLIAAAARLSHITQAPPVHFVICGNGELRAHLQQQARSLGLHNISFIDLLPEAELNTLLNMADIHLLPQQRNAADLVLPSKLSGMLASGRPVVAAALPGSEVARMVEGRGLVVEPESALGFVAAIQVLAEEPELRQHLGAVGRQFALQHLSAKALHDGLAWCLLHGADLTPLPFKPALAESVGAAASAARPAAAPSHSSAVNALR